MQEPERFACVPKNVIFAVSGTNVRFPKSLYDMTSPVSDTPRPGTPEYFPGAPNQKTSGRNAKAGVGSEEGDPENRIHGEPLSINVDPSGYKILVVDDILSNVLLLKALLKNEKYQVVTAMNGAEALRAVGEQAPDLILLDVMMPDISGFDVAVQLKMSEEYRSIPIIFLTALNSTADIVQGFKSGGNDFISKPFNKEELMIRVSHQISLIAAKNIILQQTRELRETMEGRDKLYSVIAHDLRSPMGSIKMMLNVLMNGLTPERIGPEMFEMLSMTDRTAEDVFSLLDNLLKWTKSQIGRLKVARQEFNVPDMVRSVVDVYGTVAGLKNISIEMDVPDALTVDADCDMVKTVFGNILTNAIKFSYKGGVITVSVRERDGFAEISVRDRGKGIKPEDQLKLLNTSTHFSTFGTDNEEGSGLGLLLCKDFALKNGGDLWFESVPGEGSTFGFSVPLSRRDDRP